MLNLLLTVFEDVVCKRLYVLLIVFIYESMYFVGRMLYTIEIGACFSFIHSFILFIYYYVKEKSSQNGFRFNFVVAPAAAVAVAIVFVWLFCRSKSMTMDKHF